MALVANFVSKTPPGHSVRGSTPLLPSRVFGLPEVLALATARGLRKAGFNATLAGEVMRVLSSMTETALLQGFKRGQTHLMLCGANVLPKLVVREAVLDNPEIPAAELAAAGMPVTGLDVAAVYRVLVEAVGTMQAEKAPAEPVAAVQPEAVPA